LPSDDLIRWETFKAYNKRDVETECEIIKRLESHSLVSTIWMEYGESETINDRGVLIDEKLVNNAIDISDKTTLILKNTLQKLTNLENPNSVMQLKNWLKKQGLEVEDLCKKNVQNIIKNAPSDLINLVLALRLQTSKSSIKKYEAINNCKCSDSRVRGMFQFVGASRTGRFASKFVQLQNLRQNHLANLSDVRELVKNGDIEALNLLYDDIPDVLSQLIRTAFIPKKNHKFIVADFSAIEARVLAWYAGETWVLDAFKNGEDIYCATASKMYGVPVVKHGVNGDLRQKGKQATLSCGYGGSVGALKAMGALDAGLKEDELQELVDTWRNANPHIVKFWWDVDKAIKKAYSERVTVRLNNLMFNYKGSIMYITLPSGRSIAYVRFRVREDDSITYEGKLSNTNKWGEIESYGPKFVENIVQATARDILCNSIHNLKDYQIVMHIHDEVVIEASKDVKLEQVTSLMSKSPSWAKDLLLRADGYECDFYQKD
jgi:DNA polymerase